MCLRTLARAVTMGQHMRAADRVWRRGRDTGPRPAQARRVQRECPEDLVGLTLAITADGYPAPSATEPTPVWQTNQYAVTLLQKRVPALSSARQGRGCSLRGSA